MVWICFDIIYALVVIAISIAMFVVSRRERLICIYNPNPKFPNGDKRIDEIELIATQCINFEM